jgi:ABC-type phosphate transport system auxiliary subunit
MQTDVITSLLSGGGGAAVVAFLAQLWFSRMMQRLDRQDARLRELEEKRVAAIEEQLEKIRANCRADQTRINLENLVGWMKKVDLRLEVVADSVAGLKSEMTAKNVWLQNLNETVQDHVQDHSIHRTGR